MLFIQTLSGSPLRHHQAAEDWIQEEKRDQTCPNENIWELAWCYAHDKTSQTN